MPRLSVVVGVAGVIAGAIAAGVVVAAPAIAPSFAPDPAAVASRLGFTAGERPLALRAPDNGSLSARGCGSCHADVYADLDLHV